MYFPWILAYDRLRARFEPFAPSAAAAGMLARLHAQRGVSGPDEEQDAALRPGLRPALLVDDVARERLAAAGINVLQSFRPKQPVSARTLAGAHASSPDWRFLACKRFALFLANSIERGTRWCVFHPSDPALWAMLERQVSDFFRSLEADGCFATGQPGQAWFVVCDERINVEGAPGARLLYGFAARRAGDYHSYMVSHCVGEQGVRPVTLNRLHAVGMPLSVDAAKHSEPVDPLYP